MLISLCIENFAIVSKLELDFKSGMTAFTGETGAGKSIMIDALMLALGGRADSTAIRPGTSKCDITACFDFDLKSKPAAWLKDHDIEAEELSIILRRVIYAEGRSKSYINGQPFPLQKIKELSAMLVDIHGQHQHQSLLQHATHRNQLDRYAHHPDLLADVESQYRQCQILRSRLEELEKQNSSNERTALLQYQLEELLGLNLEQDEMTTLHQEHQLLHHAQAYLEETQKISDILSADDENPNVIQLLNQVLHSLNTLPIDKSEIKSAHELINSALIQCDEAADELKRFAEDVSLDPERLQRVEERLSLLHQTARKYHIDAKQLPGHALLIEQELQALQTADEQKHQLAQAYQQQLQQYEQAAEALSQSRKKHANALADEISQSIRSLGMPNGYILVDITPLERQQAHGKDKVEYRVCTNPGMNPDSLAKIASGGELSRISLAIQMITAQHGSTPTLLFDEVDVGIGGQTAAIVGQLLRKLGARLQIFCVTHQPQVASCAHHHFVVEKHLQNDQTFSQIIHLSEPEKINEIARMLGGLTITAQTRSNAQELLRSAEKEQLQETN